MGINITQTLNNFQFENREELRNSARNLLNRQNASKENVDKIVEKSIFSENSKISSNSQFAIINASSLISKNLQLKETLKYLKSHPVKKVQKDPVFGELWDLLNEDDGQYEENIYNIEVDYSLKNIFAAA